MLNHPTLINSRPLKFDGMAEALSQSWEAGRQRPLQPTQNELGLLSTRETASRENPNALKVGMAYSKLRHVGGIPRGHRLPLKAETCDKALFRQLLTGKWIRTGAT